MKQHSKYNKKIRERNRTIVQEHKKNKSCMDCGGKYPYYVFDLDHIDPKNKVAKVSKLVGQSFSEKMIMEEIAKTEIVCANCHRKRTHKRLKSK